MKHTFKLSFFLKRSAVRKNGKTPIIGRITVNGGKVEFSTKLEVVSTKWSIDSGEGKGNSIDIKILNENLDSIRMTIYSFYRNLSEQHEIITAEKIKKLYTQTGIYPKTLLSLFKKHNEDALKLVGRGRSIVTCKKYDLAYRRVREFLIKQYGKDDIYLDNLNLQFINDYEVYLRVDCKLGVNMTAKMIQLLKKVVIMARKLGIIGFDPFFHHHTKWEKVNIEYLSRQEIERIMKKEITIKRLDVVRDVFLFSVFTGLSYIDIKNLTIDNIQERYNDDYWIITKRQKTNTKVELPLLDIPLKIMEKYKNERNGLKLLPVMSNQKVNAYLKELADICGIKKRLTFHTARYTFSTSIMLDNGISIETLSRVLGHVNIKTTQLYAKVTNMKVHKEMSTLPKK